MREHLNERQLNDWILGNAGGDTSLHLDGCATCRREAEELKKALAGFRESIHAAAESHRIHWRAPVRLQAASRIAFMTRRWVFAAALATVLVISVAVVRIDRHHPTPQTARSAGEDEILMEIETDVDQTVPSALGPGELLLAEAHQADSPSRRLSGAGRSTRR